MPKISRFLNGKWVKVESDAIIDNNEELSWWGSYSDYRGNRHKRSVVISKSEEIIYITDSFNSTSVEESTDLRLNLSEHFKDYASIFCEDEEHTELKPKANQQYYSLYYMQRDTHNQLVYTQKREKGEFRTIIKLK